MPKLFYVISSRRYFILYNIYIISYYIYMINIFIYITIHAIIYVYYYRFSSKLNSLECLITKHKNFV